MKNTYPRGIYFSNHHLLYLIIIVFIIIQILLFNYHFFPFTNKETDGIGYMHRAIGPIFQIDPFHGPGYSLAIRVLLLFNLNIFSAAKLVSIIFGIIFILSSWLIFKSFSCSKASLLSTAITAFNPIVITQSITIMSDMMAASLFLLVVAQFLIHLYEKEHYFIIAGVLGGVAYLTRCVFVIVLVVPLLWLFFSSPRDRIFRKLLGFYFGFFLIIIPWLLFLYQNTGNPFWNQNHLNIAFKMYRDGQGWNVFPSSEQFGSLLEVIGSNPILFIKVWLKTFIHIPLKLLQLFPFIAPIGYIGFFFWIAKCDHKKLILGTTLISYGIVVSLVWLEDRFLLIFIPLLASFITSAILAIPLQISFIEAKCPKIFKKIFGQVSLRTILIFVTFIFLGVITIKFIPKYFSGQAFEYKEAAKWLSKNTSINETIMAAKPHIPFFANMQYINFRSYKLQGATIEDLQAILKKSKPDYFIYDERFASVIFSNLSDLLKPENIKYFDVVFKIDTPKTLIIYRCNDD